MVANWEAAKGDPEHMFCGRQAPSLRSGRSVLARWPALGKHADSLGTINDFEGQPARVFFQFFLSNTAPNLGEPISNWP